ncbi:hypothetical protein PBI_BRIDGETTE_62 [Arthrobacter phage Bridgette]|uniref:Uncharacterized protein n=1 Tax=Arthrobacter phage Bridgette TaxID=2419949 RepID=A0A3G2KE98_9CAUD|nr:hypothetical protein HOU46_gp62 [Arthrobacter phage Bridgette]AYN57328.1 hypothetical protein PBI_BRIDGETTE_62 [Arthrobacter phage Bridgette]
MTSAALGVHAALIGRLPARTGRHEGCGQHALRRDLQAPVGCPVAVLGVDRSRRLPALPADCQRPRCGVTRRPVLGHFSWLQGADQVVTVGAMQVSHVADNTQLVSLAGGATPRLVTSNSPRHSGGVTLGTQLSSDSLRARTRRASDESYVPNVISRLTSDIKTRLQTYQLHCGRTHPRLDLSKVVSLTSLALAGVRK